MGGHFDEKKPKKIHFFKGCGEKMTVTQLMIKPWSKFPPFIQMFCLKSDKF